MFKQSITIIIILALILAAGVSFYFVTQNSHPQADLQSGQLNNLESQNNDLTNQIKQLQGENESLSLQLDYSNKTKICISDSTPISGYKTFTNDTIGISFSYPEKLGEITFSIIPGETGNLFSGVFSGSNKITFGGIDSDYSAGRGGTFLDTQGYQVSSNKYYYKFVSDKIAIDPTYLIEPLEILQVNGGKVLLLDENSFVASRGITDAPVLTVGNGNYGALANIDRNNYSGFGFWDMDTNALSISEFKKLLQSIRFL